MAGPKVTLLQYSVPAGATQLVDIAGDWLFIKRHSFLMSFQFDQGQPVTLGSRMTIQVPFSRVTIINNDASGRTWNGEIYIGEGVEPLRYVASEYLASNYKTPVDVVCGAGALTQVLSGEIRWKVLVSNVFGGGGDVRFGGMNTAANKGAILRAGERLEMPGTADLYVYNPNATPCVMALTEIQNE